ncbi:MAG TPA: sporulation protein [Actinobacteria bacterium]|nr:sporulation protein [Actinomycetota bacterium]
MKYDEILKEFIEQLKTTASVEAVFGEPKKIGNKTIIPVARIGMGGGTGGGETPEGEEAKGPRGHGGGMGVAAKPLGCIIVTDEDVKWMPVFDTNQAMLVGAFVLFTVMMTIKKIAKTLR